MSEEYKGPLTRAAEKAISTFHQSVADDNQVLYDAIQLDISIALEILLRGGGEYNQGTAINLLGTIRQQERAAFAARRMAGPRFAK